MLHKYKSNKLRFLFILDRNAPKFESDKSFYANQVSKDLLFNIYNNGVCRGYYNRNVIQDLKYDMEVNENLVFKNVTKNHINKLTIKYLEINFKDLVFEENTENTFGPWEYSGRIDDKTTMRITSINKLSSQMIYDPVLS